MCGPARPYQLLPWALLAALLAVVGCAGGGTAADAGTGDASLTPSGLVLRFADSASLQLVPLQNGVVELQVLADGVPAAGVLVRLALEGDAHDASLMTVSGPSGADGWLRTTLRASSIPATFRVRASATGATAVFLPVGVSATGFGNVQVAVEDLSATGPARVRVEAYGAVSCADSAVAEGRYGRAITLLDGETGARFLGLPATTSYAIVARATNLDGDELAFGCVDGVAVESDAEALVTVRLGARVQVIAGAYDAAFRVGAADVGALLDAARAATLALQLPSGDAPYLLDALEAYLQSENETVALASLRSARTSGLDSAFATYLSTEGAGPSVALINAVTFVAAQSELSLAGRMTIAANGDTAFEPETLQLLGPSGAYSALPAPSVGAPAITFVTELDLIGARVMFDPVVITLPLGASVESILGDAQLLSSLGSWGALAGASSAAGFPNASVEAVCNTTCRAAVFARASEAARDTWLAVLGQDPTSFTLTLRGAAAASDPDGDLRANALDAQLAGTASSSGVVLPVVGGLAATRRAEPTP